MNDTSSDEMISLYHAQNFVFYLDVPLWFYICVCTGTVTFSLCCACWCFCATWKIRKDVSDFTEPDHHHDKKSQKPKNEIDIISKSIRSSKSKKKIKSAESANESRNDDDVEQGEQPKSKSVKGGSAKSKNSRKSSKRSQTGADDLVFRVNEYDTNSYLKAVARKLFL